MARSGMSPTQRTMRYFKDLGMKVGIVERFNSHAGPFGIRQDLFFIIDIIGLDPEKGVVGIQSCGQDFAGHMKKICIEHYQETYDWITTPGASLQLIGWRKLKVKRGGKAMKWAPRIIEITLEVLNEYVDKKDEDKQPFGEFSF
jgi:hypothetical protein